MTHKETIRALLKYNKHFAKAYHCLLNWNPLLTVNENCGLLGIGIMNGYKKKKDYRLKSVVGHGPRHFRQSYRNRHEEAVAKYRLKWDGTKTLNENASACRISMNKASQVARKYALPYLKITKCSARIVVAKHSQHEKFEKCLALQGLGFNMMQIGKIVGLTRERIRQLLRP